MRVRTEIVALRSIPTGERIGYGHTWQAARPSVIATVPMGYADGLSRLLSNRGHMLARGRRAPIAGTVSMDMTMIDVTDIPGARLGDEIVVLGAQEGPLGKDAIGAEEIAAHAGTIPGRCSPASRAACRGSIASRRVAGSRPASRGAIPAEVVRSLVQCALIFPPHHGALSQRRGSSVRERSSPRSPRSSPRAASTPTRRG